MAAEHVLGISTSSGVASLAILKHLSEPLSTARELNGVPFSVLFECEIVDYKAQSAQLLPKLNAALHSLGVNAGHFMAIAVDVGPGGFTSLRTSCGLAQGLGTAWGVPCVPVTSFEAMLTNWVLQGGNSDQAVNCAIDARLNELYCATLCLENAEARFINTPYLLPVPEFVTARPGVLLCDQGAFHLAAQVGVAGTVLQPPSALGVAALGLAAALRGCTHTALDCQPLYVREKVAQTTSERLASKHGIV